MDVKCWKNKVVLAGLAVFLMLACAGQAIADPSARYAYTVKPGDSLSEIVWKFSGRSDFRKVARADNISDPDRIYPGQLVRIAACRPEAALRCYLEAIYGKEFKKAYRMLSSGSRARMSFTAFESALQSVTVFDLDAIRLCSDFRSDARHLAQISVDLKEDPAQWGFNLVWEENGWRVLLYDRYPTFPHYGGLIEWRCKP